VEIAPHLVTPDKARRQKEPEDLTLFERTLLDAFGDDPVHIDRIAALTRVAAPDALVHLLSLEFKGAVRQLPGKRFVRL
jgi:DNA processing protein